MVFIMESAKQEQGPVPPYVAYKTFKTFLRSLSQGVPARIDKSVMSSLSGGVQNQLLQTLKFFNLVDANGAPQQSLHVLAGSIGAQEDKYATTLRNLMLRSYKFIFVPDQDGHDQNLVDMTAHQLQEHFAKVASGDTVQKCIAFFVPAAKEAGFKLSPYITARKKRAGGRTTRRKDRQASMNGEADADINGVRATDGQNDTTPTAPPTWQQMLLEKFPSFDPAWNDEVKAKWFDAFDALMKKGGQS